MKIPFIVTDTSITVYVKGKPYTTSSGNCNFLQIRQRIADGLFDGIEDLFDAGKAITDYAVGKLVIKGNSVYYNGLPVHGHTVNRILAFMREGLPYQPLLKFLEKLLQNPSARAVEELYKFLENKNMPLTPDGNFLSYKGVSDSFYSISSGDLTLLKGKADGKNNTGHIFNGVGQEVECPRNEVSDNFNDGCARGLHIGSLDYAKGWGQRMVIVEVNPADVVCIPHNDVQKMRCCHYKVVGTFERALTEPMFAPSWAKETVAKSATPAPKSKSGVSDATRAKLRAAALRQRRDSNGQYI